MIHMNKGGLPHEWLTEEQFKERYPDLDFGPPKFADEAKRIQEYRRAGRILLREISAHLGISHVEASKIDLGYVRATPEQLAKIEELFRAKEAENAGK